MPAGAGEVPGGLLRLQHEAAHQDGQSDGTNIGGGVQQRFREENVRNKGSFHSWKLNC